MNKSRILTLESKVFFVLSFFFILLFFVSTKATLALEEPSLIFSETSKIVSEGNIFEVDIIVDTAGETAHGVGAKINFNPEILEVVSIQPGTIFGDYPVASYDNSSGKVIVSGIASSKNNFFKGSGVFARLTFQAKNDGETSVEFIYEPGSTTDSNIAVIYGTGDILSQVNNLSVAVSPGVGGSALAPVTSDTQPPEPERLSFFEKILRFLGLYREPESVREGRPASESIDAHDPIPSQSPITDSNQAQPVNFIGSPDEGLFSRILKIFIVGALVIGLALLIKRFVIKSRFKKATVFQNVDNKKESKV